MFTHTRTATYDTQREKKNPLMLLMLCSENKNKTIVGIREGFVCENLPYQTAGFTTNKPSIIPSIKEHFTDLMDIPIICCEL